MQIHPHSPPAEEAPEAGALEPPARLAPRRSKPDPLPEPPRAGSPPLTLEEYRVRCPDPTLPDEGPAADPLAPLTLAAYRREVGDPGDASLPPSPSAGVAREMTFEDYKQAVPKEEVQERAAAARQAVVPGQPMVSWFEPWKTGSSVSFEEYKRRKQQGKDSTAEAAAAAAAGEWDAPKKEGEGEGEGDRKGGDK